jgi:hypothetical protein
LSENDFYTPTDLDILRMENELLAFEVRFLKARGGSAPSSGSSISLSRRTHLEEAENDLVLLLRRLGGSPLGPALRLGGGFREMERRYLSSDGQASLAPAERVAYLEGAERDLVRLLGLLGRGPLGAVLRRRRSFRTLEQRYL